MRIHWVVRLGCILLMGACLPAVAESRVTLQKHSHGVHILIDSVPVMEYIWRDDALPRPYFKQLKTINGLAVSRTYPPDPIIDSDNDDHSTYHPGAWLAFGDVNGTDFWRNKAKVEHHGITHMITSEDGSAQFGVFNVYKTKNDVTIMTEECHYLISSEKHGYLVRAISTFSMDNDFAFGDQEEMGFGVRLATGLRVRGGNGAMRNSEGGVNEAGTWGKSADWLAGYGSVDGQGVGMMVVADPANFRKSWFHSRDYGLIVANPFGKKAMTGPNDDTVKNDSTLVKKGEKFIVGFGVYVFNYATNGEPAFDVMYADYLKRNDGN